MELNLRGIPEKFKREGVFGHKRIPIRLRYSRDNL